jgi:hypothetical protein
VAQVKYDGVSSAEFNKNTYIPLRLLNEGNEGVQFTRLEYKRDYYNANNLKEIFDFYRKFSIFIEPGLTPSGSGLTVITVYRFIELSWMTSSTTPIALNI